MINPRQAEQELDEAYVTETRFELGLMVRQSMVDWARGFGPVFQVAVFSAVNGRWDDVRRDVREGRITQDDYTRLLDKFLSVKLISQRQYDWYNRQVSQ